MAILGKNGLYAGALYLAALYALYGMKNVSFKDSKEIDAIQIIVARKGKPKKGDIANYRAQKLKQVLASDAKRYADLLGPDAKTGKQKEFGTAYGKKEWLR